MPPIYYSRARGQGSNGDYGCSYVSSYVSFRGGRLIGVVMRVSDTSTFFIVKGIEQWRRRERKSLTPR
jgi:hypothetical protein